MSRKAIITEKEKSLLAIWFKHRVTAKEAAAEIGVSYQSVYFYYRAFKDMGFKQIPLAEVAMHA